MNNTKTSPRRDRFEGIIVRRALVMMVIFSRGVNDSRNLPTVEPNRGVQLIRDTYWYDQPMNLLIPMILSIALHFLYTSKNSCILI